MREYRGKRKDSGEWVYGSYLKDRNEHYIFPDKRKRTFIGHFACVIPETVGQSTGLHDKNGKDLDWWEGDLLKDPEDGTICIIEYNPYGSGFYLRRCQDTGSYWLPLFRAKNWIKIGTIHDTELKP